VLAAAMTALVVFAVGRARATLAPTYATVRVAMVTLPESPFAGIAALRDGRVDPARAASLATAVGRATDTLFTLSARAADSGARIIAWAEENAAVLAEDEPALVARAARFARERGVYLAIAYAAVDPRRARPVDNQLRLLTPQGTTAWQYRKHHPVADEVTTMLIGADTVPVADTEYGRVAGVICYDTDFPRDLRRNLGARADLLLAPSNDWAGITTVRGINTRYRALENGVTLIRPASHGVSEAIDPWGRPLAVGEYAAGDAILMAQVPVRGGVATWYGRLGDLAPAACALILVLMLGRARRTR
jgi:apolipoprotein N-acyltransferase